jgi:2-amino-4-hydroxy-6-hydroxymethyldihydropteridine diphosphokinase
VTTLGFLGLGSNIGDRRSHLAAAAAALAGHGVEVLGSSSVYETEPVGLVPDQPDLFNACLLVRTRLGPEPLLEVCKEVEHEIGRAADGARHGPREIDVDVLMLGALEYSSKRLTLPHPEVRSRRFVLVPLLELEPELALPSGERLADMLAQLPAGQAVRRVSPALV